MSFWTDKRVLVTGGTGFLGSFVVDKLNQRGCRHVFVPRSKDYDLRDRDSVIRVYTDAKPQFVIHLAASRWHRRKPGKPGKILLR